MSATSQTNGKKSSNSSTVNTPASTPLTNGNPNGPQTTPPLPNNNAPKYGTLVPNRIFVGGISANTTEGELLQLFSNYGTVKAAKIIQDRAGVSRGYGFITFESEDDAKRPLKDADNIVLRERKLNIAPAIKKQPFNRAFDASSPPAVAPGNPAQYFFPPSAGVPYFQTAGVTYYPQPAPAAPGDPNSQPATVYQDDLIFAAPPVYPAQSGPPQAPGYPSMMFPQTIYMPQQYPMPLPYDFNYYTNNGGPQYMVGGQNGPSAPPTGSGQGPPGMPPSNSPPRPPCYNPQLHYNPDAVFYNVPMFGAPIEGTPPMYTTDGLELSNNGNNYNEVSRGYFDYTRFNGERDGNGINAGAQGTQFSFFCDPTAFVHELDFSTISQQLQSNNSNNDSVTPGTMSSSSSTPLTATNTTCTTATTLLNHDNRPSSTHVDNTSNTNNDNSDNNRQSKTPVVSLLSMEHNQEKDFVSMQGGRRVKPLQQAQPASSQQPTVPQQTINFPPFCPTSQCIYPSPMRVPPPTGFNPFNTNNSTTNTTNHSNNISGTTNTSRSHSVNYKTGNGRDMMNGWRKPRYNNNNSSNNNNNNNNQSSNRHHNHNSNLNSNTSNNNNDHHSSSLSSLRTDSNSSANAMPDTDDHNTTNNKLGTNNSSTTIHNSQMLPSFSTSTYNGIGGNKSMNSSVSAWRRPHSNNHHHYHHHHHHHNNNNNNNNNSKQQQQQQSGSSTSSSSSTTTTNSSSITNNTTTATASSAATIPTTTSNNSNTTTTGSTNNNNNERNKSYLISQNQVRNNNGQQQNYAVQPSQVASRRNKRQPRRSNQPGGGGSLSEIGAGDAPSLTNPPDVAEACKKMDALKL